MCFAVQIMRDIDTKASRGFGFVTFNDVAPAAAAIQALNGRQLSGAFMDRAIKVSHAVSLRRSGNYHGGQGGHGFRRAGSVGASAGAPSSSAAAAAGGVGGVGGDVGNSTPAAASGDVSSAAAPPPPLPAPEAGGSLAANAAASVAVGPKL